MSRELKAVEAGTAAPVVVQQPVAARRGGGRGRGGGRQTPATPRKVVQGRTGRSKKARQEEDDSDAEEVEEPVQKRGRNRQPARRREQSASIEREVGAKVRAAARAKAAPKPAVKKNPEKVSHCDSCFKNLNPSATSGPAQTCLLQHQIRSTHPQHCGAEQ